MHESSDSETGSDSEALWTAFAWPPGLGAGYARSGKRARRAVRMRDWDSDERLVRSGNARGGRLGI